MENIINDFTENIADVATLETMDSNFYLYATNSPGPEDEDDEAEEEGADSSQGSEEDPPLDEGVVHSPVPPKAGNPK
jgi:hypothetical protein